MGKKQAVLLLHGIGEQLPMATLRGFVDAVWKTDTSIHHEHAKLGVWSKPDTASRSFELRRITTSKNASGTQTDFYEFYWAHLMSETSFGHVIAWARSLLLRLPSKVPEHLRSVYVVLWIVAVVAVGLAAYAASTTQESGDSLPGWVAALLSLCLIPLGTFVMLRIVGDAARYLHVSPTNIQRRHEIRQAGISLLKELHDPKREYDRIIVVGHSLGTVIGYDILTHAWTEYHREYVGTEMKKLDELEDLINTKPLNVDKLQIAQRDLFSELRANGSKWLVTDFVTMGCPLAHAAILLAADKKDLEQKQFQREFPTCPPAVEVVERDGQEVKRISYEKNGRTGFRVPHHAAVFGPTRWTNLYFRCRGIIYGDLVGGPLRETMGKGVRDIEVVTSRWFGFLTHTFYWSPTPNPTDTHIAELRKAVDLLDHGYSTSKSNTTAK